MENGLDFKRKDAQRKKLILVTEDFPLRQAAEESFIIPELQEIVKFYDVSIVSCCVEAEGAIPEFKKEFENMVKLYHYQPPKGQYFKQFIKLLGYLFQPVFLKELTRVLTSGGNFIAKAFWVFLNYYWADDFAKWMEKIKIVEHEEKVIYYTFWNQYYLLAMVMRRKYFPNMKIISRIHGCDLFQDRSPMKWQPFKNYMDKKTDRTIFIAEQGKTYYENQYQAHAQADRHIICRLGVAPQNVDIKKRRKEFLLVSCAAFVPIKRIDLIVKALGLIQDREITWIHFGKGYEREKNEKLVEKLLTPLKNIHIEFKGFCSNKDVLAFYKKCQPSCFITVSQTEGSPVSMQEAVACGIPVIGTDVGGIYEMVDGNGILLSPDPSAKEVANAIRKIYDTADEEYFKMRERSLEIWESKFNRQKNNEAFIRMLGEL